MKLKNFPGTLFLNVFAKIVSVATGNPEFAYKIITRYSLKSFLKLFINQFYYFFKSDKPPYLLSLVIEPTNKCNLTCQHCRRPDMTRRIGEISIDLYKRIIDENLSIAHVLLVCLGEPLMHDKIIDMINYAGERKIRPMIITNGILLTHTMADMLLDSKLHSIAFSIDGIYESYEKIRHIKYAVIKNNIVYFLEKKKRARKKIWTEIIMTVSEKNEGDIEAVRKEWQGCVDQVSLQPEIIYHGNKRIKRCKEIYRGNLIVFWDGTVVPCCVDFDGRIKIGNTQEDKLLNLWNSDKMRTLRRFHIEGNFVGLCGNCSEYTSQRVRPRLTV
ncbi:MAG: radical SAM protein [Candidatus Brocadia sp.]|jgi:pyruvate-formate lyase-activating enzyme